MDEEFLFVPLDASEKDGALTTSNGGQVKIKSGTVNYGVPGTYNVTVDYYAPGSSTPVEKESTVIVEAPENFNNKKEEVVAKKEEEKKENRASNTEGYVSEVNGKTLSWDNLNTATVEEAEQWARNVFGSNVKIENNDTWGTVASIGYNSLSCEEIAMILNARKNGAKINLNNEGNENAFNNWLKGCGYGN